VANFLKFLNFSGGYEKKPGIPTSRYFALSVESDCISNSSICGLSSALATPKVNGLRIMQSGVQKMRIYEIFPKLPLITIPGDCHT
jgi:hypothetical protein